MREFIDFTLFIIGKVVAAWFGLDLGSHSFGSFLVAAIVVGLFIGCLVIRFRNSGSVSTITRPSSGRSPSRKPR